MSDFDKRLSNMMNEEEHFPNMQQNWERLSPHLQPPQPLKTSYRHKRWFIGIAASVSVLAVSAMSYFLLKTNQENKALQNEVAILKNKTQDIDNKTITHSDNSTIDKKNYPVNASKNSVSPAENFDKKEVLDKGLNGKVSNKGVANEVISSQKVGANEPKIIASNSVKIPVSQNKPIIQKEKIQKEGPSVFLEKKEVLGEKQVEKKANIAQNETPMPSKNADDNSIIVPSENKENKENSTTIISNNGDKPVLNNETADATSVKEADFAVSPLGIVLKPTIVSPAKGPLSMEGILMQKPIIRHTTPRTGKFAVGLQTFVSLGENEGRDRKGPALMGYGLIASYELTRNFEVLASLDLGDMRYEFKDRGPRGGRTPEEPKEKPLNHPRLKEASGKQDRQQFSIGLKYKIPTNTILTPYVNVGYDLQRLGKQTCNFNFVNDTTKSESSVAQVVDSQIAKNLWHVGAGLEARIYSFTVDVSAQYQKDFSINNDNRVVIRGGIKYRF
jgi:Outer membrane protein beta-barrel domain